MLALILERRGHKTWLGGNLGGSLLADLGPIAARDDFVVLELSSFQLHWLSRGMGSAAGVGDRYRPHAEPSSTGGRVGPTTWRRSSGFWPAAASRSCSTRPIGKFALGNDFHLVGACWPSLIRSCPLGAFWACTSGKRALRAAARASTSWVVHRRRSNEDCNAFRPACRIGSNGLRKSAAECSSTTPEINNARKRLERALGAMSRPVWLLASPGTTRESTRRPAAAAIVERARGRVSIWSHLQLALQVGRRMNCRRVSRRALSRRWTKPWQGPSVAVGCGRCRVVVAGLGKLRSVSRLSAARSAVRRVGAIARALANDEEPERLSSNALVRIVATAAHLSENFLAAEGGNPLASKLRFR